MNGVHVEYEIAWGGEPEDVLLTTRGEVTVRDLHEMIREGMTDARFREQLKVLIDHRKATWWSLSNDEIRQRAALIRADSEKLGRQRVAFVMGSHVDVGIGRIFQGTIADLSHIEFDVFDTPADARVWLEQMPLS